MNIPRLNKIVPDEVAMRNFRRRTRNINSEVGIIAVKVANHFNIPVSELKRNVRKRGIVQARQIAMYLSIRYTTKTLDKIGEYFDKDHSTVKHAEKAVLDQIETNRNFAEIVGRIERELNNNL